MVESTDVGRLQIQRGERFTEVLMQRVDSSGVRALSGVLVNFAAKGWQGATRLAKRGKAALIVVMFRSPSTEAGRTRS